MCFWRASWPVYAAPLIWQHSEVNLVRVCGRSGLLVVQGLWSFKVYGRSGIVVKEWRWASASIKIRLSADSSTFTSQSQNLARMKMNLLIFNETSKNCQIDKVARQKRCPAKLPCHSSRLSHRLLEECLFFQPISINRIVMSRDRFVMMIFCSRRKSKSGRKIRSRSCVEFSSYFSPVWPFNSKYLLITVIDCYEWICFWRRGNECQTGLKT